MSKAFAFYWMPYSNHACSVFIPIAQSLVKRRQQTRSVTTKLQEGDCLVAEGPSAMEEELSEEHLGRQEAPTLHFLHRGLNFSTL